MNEIRSKRYAVTVEIKWVSKFSSAHYFYLDRPIDNMADTAEMFNEVEGLILQHAVFACKGDSYYKRLHLKILSDAKVYFDSLQSHYRWKKRMSQLLDELIKRRKEEALEYEQYLEEIKKLAEQISQPTSSSSYPETLKSNATRALYDNLQQNENMAIALDAVILTTKLDNWRDGGIRERKLKLAVLALLPEEDKTRIDEIMDIIKAQREY